MDVAGSRRARAFGGRLRTHTLALLVTVGQVTPWAAFAHGSLHERSGAMDRLVAENPRWAEPLLRRAELFREHGDLERALEDIARARKLDPDLSRIDFHLARVYLDQGRLEEARSVASDFLVQARSLAGLEPLIPSTHRLLARIALRSGDGLGAAEQLSQAITASERPAPVLFILRAEAFQSAGTEHLDDAVAALDAGVRELGPLASLQQRALALELERRDYAAALLRIDAMMGAAPTDPKLVVRKGNILEQGGRRDQALEAYSLALRSLEGRSPATRKTPAMAGLRAEIEQAIRRLSNHPPLSDQRPETGDIPND